MKVLSIVSLAIVLGGLDSAPDRSAQALEPSSVPYPSGYRKWVMVKSFVVTKESRVFPERGGFHHYYANEKALEGYRTGKFPKGSVIVDEGVYAKDNDGTTNEAALRSVEVMHKHPKYQATEGWGYERFEGDSRAGSGGKAQAACFACHTKVKNRDYVFSTSRSLSH